MQISTLIEKLDISIFRWARPTSIHEFSLSGSMAARVRGRQTFGGRIDHDYEKAINIDE